MKRHPLTIAIGALLLTLFVLLLFFFQVRQSEIAVVTTFGEPKRIAEPGPHVKLPWPIQKVHKFDQRFELSILNHYVAVSVDGGIVDVMHT